MLDNKDRLFELMGINNPSNKGIDIHGVQDIKNADIKHLESAFEESPALVYANSKIDTPKEFKKAFQVWLGTTGFKPEEGGITIGQVQTIVRDVMLSMGYK